MNTVIIYTYVYIKYNIDNKNQYDIWYNVIIYNYVYIKYNIAQSRGSLPLKVEAWSAYILSFPDPALSGYTHTFVWFVYW